MYVKDTQVVFDALVDQIKKLKLDLILKDAENDKLRAELNAKTSGKVGTDNA